MGGQLSCVSCKNRKETTTNVKTKKKAEAQPTPQSLATSANDKSYSPVTSGWELYQIVRARNSATQKEDEKLSDVEKVARAIVDINIYLASQVIYPAIEKFLQETQQNDIAADRHQAKDEEEQDGKTICSTLPHNDGRHSPS